MLLPNICCLELQEGHRPDYREGRRASVGAPRGASHQKQRGISKLGIAMNTKRGISKMGIVTSTKRGIGTVHQEGHRQQHDRLRAMKHQNRQQLHHLAKLILFEL